MDVPKKVKPARPQLIPIPVASAKGFWALTTPIDAPVPAPKTAGSSAWLVREVDIPEKRVAWATKSGASGSKGIREGPATWLAAVLVELAMLSIT